MKPNIFHFATSELSQDAFLFWLLLHANLTTDDSKACAMSRLFINELFEHEIGKSLRKPKDLTTYKIIPYRQFLNIDILLLFESTHENNKFLILIEDKVNASESRESQVSYYLSKLSEREEFRSTPILPIYFKTGYTSIQEVDYISKSKIIYLGIEQIDSLVKKTEQHSKEDIILDSWISFYKETYAPIIEAKNYEIKESHSLQTIYQNVYKNISDELYFTRITEFLFKDLSLDFSTECYPVQGIGHVDWHFSITKPNWSNKDKNFSFGIYFLWDGDYSLKLKTSTFEYIPMKSLTDDEKIIYQENQSKLKERILEGLTSEWQITNYPLQIAKLPISRDESIENCRLYIMQQIIKINKIVD
jgi:hypothetical protein